MVKSNENLNLYFSNFTIYARSVLRCTTAEIKKLFLGTSKPVLNHTQKISGIQMLEIKFDKEMVISCLFDKNGYCDFSFLFFYDQNSEEYIDYLNGIYQYDFIQNYWKLPDCRVCIKIQENDVIFVFRPK